MASNSAGFARLQEQIDRIRSLPVELVKRAGPEIAKEGLAEVTANVARAVGPDGTPWAKTQSGDAPLRNAASHVTVKAEGTRIVFRVSGVDAKHHRGRVKGGERRPIIPVKSIPQPLTIAIKRVLGKHFKNVMGGT